MRLKFVTIIIFTIIIKNVSAQAIKASNNGPICVGQTLILTTNIAGATYSWKGPGGFVSAVQTPTISGTTPAISGVYTVTITVALPPSVTIDSTTVKINPLPLASITNNNNGIGCQSINAVFTGSNGTAPYSFICQLNNIAQTPVNTQGSASAANLSLQNIALGTYTLSLIEVKDSNLCSSTILNNSTTINVFQKPNAVFSISPPQTTVSQPISINDASIGAVAYMWDFGDNSTSFSSNPGNHTYADTGTYKVKLTITSNVGCKDSTYQTELIKIPLTLYVPNTFTPNDDEKNDIFMSKGDGISKFELNVFDRWGIKVFSANDINTGWNGKINGGSEVALKDTYVYIIDVRAVSNDHDYTYKGCVDLVR